VSKSEARLYLNVTESSSPRMNIYLTWARTRWKWVVKFDHVADNPPR
jgi:hypothetical protein